MVVHALHLSCHKLELYKLLKRDSYLICIVLNIFYAKAYAKANVPLTSFSANITAAQCLNIGPPSKPVTFGTVCSGHVT